MRKLVKGKPAERGRIRRGRPVDLAKRRAVICAAQDVFVNNGYEATSIDAVAASAKVSKLTIYKHFGTKEALFAAALNDKCDHFMPPDAIRLAGPRLPRDGLIQIGHSFLALILDPEVLKMHRVVMAEATNHPRVAALFFDKAVQPTTAKVVEFLRAEAKSGRLKVPDAERAAWEYLSLLKGRPMFMALLNIPLPGKAELGAHVEACADMFLRAYGAAKKTAGRPAVPPE